ncbi:HD domain-containing protein [Patescibacteria group bacterium]|nr:HD domain-containing protein [Patescibacteria group bacterium]MBU4512419.1 HD domain-containing protein [Patescibacteria group bacterium]MCG2693269.1 HD domain-containing protein [Candidatus Parcubacteria bacterium]
MQKKEDFLKNIEDFAEAFIGTEKNFQIFASEKIINDAVWGTHRFEPFELSVISLPIIQRLRQIRQMGFVNYVYPSALHSRFEHTLGTAILAEKLFFSSKKKGEKFLDDKDLINIRLSALLHDIGHCLFSHSSELLYGDLLTPFIEDEKFEADPKPHEYLTYRLIKTKAFSNFFSFISNKYRISIDQAEVANFVIGSPSSETNRFKSSIINGAFDADKLDYIYRDSRFSGLPLLLDLDRLMHEIAISDFREIRSDIEIKDLTIGISGVSSLEQIIFNKMLLFSTIYHHQKVKACDCMFKGVYEYIIENNIELPFRGKKLSFRNACDFLWFTDTEFMAVGIQTADDEIHRMIIIYCIGDL